ncbi:MAG: hypothetical protein V3S20_01645 [Dehalococcoidia bacterium]
MQVVSDLDARLELKAFIDRARAPNRDWYVGIAADPDERLSEHGLRENDWYLVRRLGSADAARRVEDFLLKLGCDGGSGGGDEESTAVYAYWKRGHTTP